MWSFFNNLFAGRRKKVLPRNYFVSSATQSQERVRKLGLRLPHAEGTTMLDVGKLSVHPVIEEEDEYKVYKPDPYFEWVVDLTLDKGGYFTREDITRLFDLSWRQNFRGATIYGLSLTTHKWTYAMSGDSPERYSQLQIGVSLLEFYADGPGDPARLQNCIDAVVVKLRTHRLAGAQPQLAVAESVEAAALRAVELLRLKQQLHLDVVITLKSDTVYSGVAAWDVLSETGLHWGDGDLFHWINADRQFGGDQFFFSVWTSSAPGYFFPEAIKAGTFNPVNLVFGYWVGRNTDPVGVFDVLVEVVRHCREVLGGVLLGQDGEPFDEERQRARVQQVVVVMNGKGLTPGADRALRMFQ